MNGAGSFEPRSKRAKWQKELKPGKLANRQKGNFILVDLIVYIPELCGPRVRLAPAPPLVRSGPNPGTKSKQFHWSTQIT